MNENRKMSVRLDAAMLTLLTIDGPVTRHLTLQRLTTVLGERYHTLGYERRQASFVLSVSTPRAVRQSAARLSLMLTLLS